MRAAMREVLLSFYFFYDVKLPRSIQKWFTSVVIMIPNEHWVLQIMLQSPSIVAASLSKCKHIGLGNNASGLTFITQWLANVDIEKRMPSSAYRKLMGG